KLRDALSSGSPKAEVELDFDPLGLITPALKPLAGSFSIDQTRPLASPDGTLRIVLAKTTQPDLSARACQITMAQVADFQKRVLQSWTGPTPQILVTGRTPYVGELSLTMRSDVISTITGSVLLVALVFYLGFRRFTPLLAILKVLTLCCLLAVATGSLLFHELNMITIGLCSILIGLGVDFGMMLYAVYERARDAGTPHEAAIAAAIRSQGKGVFFGALTTAIGFLCFLRSQSPGFAQLGALIACGILFAGIFMATLFFAFIGPRFHRHSRDWLWSAGQSFVRLVYQNPRAFFLSTTLFLTTLSTLAFTPIGQLRFDANPRSLEPKESRAGHALRTIQSKMPIAAEPLILLVNASTPEELHSRWSTLQSTFNQLVANKKIKGVASPTAFAVSPKQIERNASQLAQINWTASRQALTQALQLQGFSPNSFQSAFDLLDSLQSIATGNRAPLHWRSALPESSTWWFVLDRFFSQDPLLCAAYLTPNHTLSSFAEKEEIRLALESPKIPIQISGWSYTLQDLVPWSKSKMIELSAFMILFNGLLLIFLYRSIFPLAILMLGLALSIGSLVTTLKCFDIPLNLFNVLAFPLVLGVGVDYGIYIVIAMRQSGLRQENLATVVKPVFLSGLTTVCGFASLALAANPALKGLGIVCSLGVAWSLFATLFFILPAYAWRDSPPAPSTPPHP
ncbi:MAG: MMPL family transporter, partial [Verrucomicrobia bacterium]|nr:MMPL family transporter [Verrucomicrobiota bacterium]